MLFLGFFFCALVSAQLRVTLESKLFQLESQTDSFPVTVTLTNAHWQKPITLIKWDTPLDDAAHVLRADMFEIVHEATGAKAVYTGIVMKRYPVLSDFITLNPGQSTTVVLDLFKGYYFPAEGEYKIQLRTATRMQVGGDLEADSILETYNSFNIEVLGSNSIHVNVVSLKSAPFFGVPLASNLTGPSPKSNCNSGQAGQINTAGNNAISASAQGANYLSGSCSSSLSYYITWFGACDSTRFSKVRSNLQAINNGLRANYPVDCAGSSCSSNTYAYVFPADTTHTVYVCAVFWRVTSNNCVMDSQPGTIIHEMGHFNNVAALKDVTYGQSSCQTLAKNNPSSAITNADNYCFYTDSCPR
jgi:peptidyl-Lys metalloendopeptidase